MSHVNQQCLDSALKGRTHGSDPNTNGLLSSRLINPTGPPMPTRQQLRDAIANLTPNPGANALAGVVASLVTIAYCVSFSALLFQGDLKSGLAMGLWGLFVGSAVAGLYVSLTTSLPPAEAAPDNPAVAVLSVLAATVAGPVLAAGGPADAAVVHVLLAFSLATLVTGTVLYLLGAFGLAQSVRFVPYPVIGGFLAASGWFLVTGGIEVVTGREFTVANLADLASASTLPQLVLSLAFAIAVLAAKRRLGSAVLPIAFFGGAVLLDAALWAQGLMHAASGWYIAGAAHPLPWVPLQAAASGGISWQLLLDAAPEIAAVAGVTVLALLLDVTGLEVARGRTADLDHEFRTNGAANILAAPLGGLMGNLSMNGSRLLDETGGGGRLSGVVASLVVVLVVLTGVDLPALIPAPILAGLLMYLGLVVLSSVLLNSPAHRAWTDLGLALLIMLAIVRYGYLTGVVLGFIAACLMFAFSYSRVAVIRRHLTRAEFASNVDRAPASNEHLLQQGDRIHVFWLSGFIFFGSSNGVLEQIRDALAPGDDGGRYVVLDLTEVSGFDTSALLSLVKLRNHCREAGVTLVFAGASAGMERALHHLGVLAATEPHRSFAGRNEALAWCEERVLATASGSVAGAEADLVSWLTDELGSHESAQRIVPYFDRHELPAGTVLYSQDTPSDTIDLVVAGSVDVVVEGGGDLPLLIRRMDRKTVVGEMGFFRGNPRRATVSVIGESLVYTLTRQAYDRLCAEDPQLANAFLTFIVRALADRLEFANRGIAALS
jgi:SulP family sulfate permease